MRAASSSQAEALAGKMSEALRSNARVKPVKAWIQLHILHQSPVGAAHLPNAPVGVCEELLTALNKGYKVDVDDHPRH